MKFYRLCDSCKRAVPRTKINIVLETLEKNKVVTYNLCDRCFNEKYEVAIEEED